MGYFIFLFVKNSFWGGSKGLLAAGTSSDCSCCVDENVCKVMWTGNKCSKNNFPSVWNLFDGIYMDSSIISVYAINCISFQCLMILEYHWTRKGLLSLLAPGISPWAVNICYMDTCNFFYVCACCTVQDYYFLPDSLLLLVFVVVEEPLLKKEK